MVKLLKPVDIVTIPRSEFLSDYWDYKAGEHVTILAPSGGGKTHLGYQLLDATATEQLPAIVLVMKPRDETVDKFTRRTRFRIVRQWPPPTVHRLINRKPRGWVLWPAFTFIPEVDEKRHSIIFRRAIQDSYKTGHRIIFADETYSLEEELNLTTILRTVWTKGRSMGCGLWAASQRPVYISKWAYQSHHLFIGNDPDDDARRRLSEIGAAVDKEQVRQVVGRLKKRQFLYINRDERTMAIIDA